MQNIVTWLITWLKYLLEDKKTAKHCGYEPGLEPLVVTGGAEEPEFHFPAEHMSTDLWLRLHGTQVCK